MLFWQGGSPLSTLSTHLQQERVLLLQIGRRQGCVSPDLLDALPRTRAIHPPNLPSYSCPSATLHLLVVCESLLSLTNNTFSIIAAISFFSA
jgi:hypothetical protein